MSSSSNTDADSMPSPQVSSDGTAKQLLAKDIDSQGFRHLIDLLYPDELSSSRSRRSPYMTTSEDRVAALWLNMENTFVRTCGLDFVLDPANDEAVKTIRSALITAVRSGVSASGLDERVIHAGAHHNASKTDLRPLASILETEVARVGTEKGRRASYLAYMHEANSAEALTLNDRPRYYGKHSLAGAKSDLTRTRSRLLDAMAESAFEAKLNREGLGSRHAVDEAGTPLSLVNLGQKMALLLVGTVEKGMSRGILSSTLLSEKHTHEAVLRGAEAEYKKLAPATDSFFKALDPCWSRLFGADAI